MKHKKYKSKSKYERKKLKKKEKRRHKKKSKESDSNSSEEEQEWIEKPICERTFKEQNIFITSKKEEFSKKEDWMNIKSILPCVFNEKKKEFSNSDKNIDKSDMNKLNQNKKELNPYWKNGGNGLPEKNSTNAQPKIDINWLKKGLQRAKEQAESQNKNLKDIVAERWGSLEMIESMISESKESPIKNRSKFENQYNNEKCENRQFSNYIQNSNKNNQYKNDNITSKYENNQKQKYKMPINDDYFNNSSNKINNFVERNLKSKISNNDEKEFNSNNFILKNAYNDDVNIETKPLTEAEMNKLGAKIVKAEIMGNIKLADELKMQLQKAREIIQNTQICNIEKIPDIILTQTDAKGITRPLEPRIQSIESLQNMKRKNAETHVFGKKVRHYFDDDKYSLQKLFQKEKGRSTNEDDATFMKAACKGLDMDEIFEEHITYIKTDKKQNEKDRLIAIKEHEHLSKSLDNCYWCIDSKYMLKHMIIAMDSEICLSLPQYTSLTIGHCIITPLQHIACQLQLDENIWEKLKLFKRALYKMFMDQNQYPVFYEIYKSSYKFSHMRLECVPIPKEIGELAPIYFKKALLECETEWSMNKKIINLEHKDIRQAIPNGLSYFMVEFETNKGYAHVIEDEHMFSKNFAEEIIGGMLDLKHNIWRKPKKENVDQQHEKVLKFSKIWKKYEYEIKNYN